MSSERSEHDYVVVGAGPAGSVIIRRLLDHGHTVHVLESGPDAGCELVGSPGKWPELFGGRLDWAVRTVPQKHANGRSLFLPRGRVVGGSSALNGMIYMRGARSDYDVWSYGGATGWAWKNVLPYFLRSEDHQDGAGPWHGAGGPLPVTRIDDPHPTSAAFVDAGTGLGYPRTEDFNGGHPLGVGFNHLTVRDGRRMSAWAAFVEPVRTCPGSVLPRTCGSSVSRSRRICPASGRTCTTTTWSPTSMNRPDRCPPAVQPAGEPAPVEVRPAAGGARPAAAVHPRLYPADGFPVPEHGYTIAAGIIRPLSRGNLRLASADPESAPLVDLNVLGEDHDLDIMVDALEICRELGRADSFAAWRRAETAPGPAARTRDDLREFVRRTIGTYHHQVGTCRMGQDSLSVVDRTCASTGYKACALPMPR
jgi:choline dehydrogenase